MPIPPLPDPPTRNVRIPTPDPILADYSLVDAGDMEPALRLDAALIFLAGSAAGAAIAVFLVPAALPELSASILSSQPKVYWYLSRSAGVVAYLVLWLSAVLGLSLTNRLARLWPGGPAAADVHQFSALLALALILFHVVILLGDRFANYAVWELLVPFAASAHAPFWVGLGQVAFYLALPVTFTFYIRRAIGVRTWRLIHYLSFGVLVLTVAHGIGAGTDGRTAAMLGMYIVTGCILVFLTTYRVAVTAHRRRPARLLGAV